MLCEYYCLHHQSTADFFAIWNYLLRSKHLNESYQISSKYCYEYEAQIYGSLFIVLVLLLNVCINYSNFVSVKQKLGDGEKLLSGCILSHIFKKDHSWSFFFWVISTGMLVSSSMKGEKWRVKGIRMNKDEGWKMKDERWRMKEECDNP